MKRIKFTKCFMVIVVLAVALIFTFSQTAQALQIKLDDGLTSVTIVDNGAGDTDTTVGSLVYSGSIGNFTMNFTVGWTKPIYGSGSLPKMHLHTLHMTSTGGGTMTVSMTETGFGPVASGISGFYTGIGGMTGGTVTLNSYFDTCNIPFAQTTALGSLGPFTGPIFSGGITSNTLPASNPFSLTMVSTVTHTAGSQTTSFNAEINPVPEPGTILLLGICLLGLGIVSRKKIGMKS